MLMISSMDTGHVAEVLTSNIRRSNLAMKPLVCSTAGKTKQHAQHRVPHQYNNYKMIYIYSIIYLCVWECLELHTTNATHRASPHLC